MENRHRLGLDVDNYVVVLIRGLKTGLLSDGGGAGLPALMRVTGNHSFPDGAGGTKTVTVLEPFTATKPDNPK